MTYGGCSLANMFGSNRDRLNRYQMVHWYSYRGFTSLLHRLELKIRPRDFGAGIGSLLACEKKIRL